MTELLPILQYLHIKYSKACCECSVSVPRLVKMLYLADWKSALDYGEPLTSVEWRIDDCGPNTDEVFSCLTSNPEYFSLDVSLDDHGRVRVTVALYKPEDFSVSFPEKCLSTLDFVLGKMSKLTWAEVTKLVISTYPVLTQATGSCIDLAELAATHRDASG